MVFEKIKFLAANVAPKPDEVSYWVDISANPYGGVIKYYDGYDWIKLDQDSIAEDYLKLRNKPTLNGVVIEGNKTSEDYNIPTPESVELVLNDFRNEINNIDEKVSNVSIKLDNYIEANEGNIEDIKQDIVNIQESLELILGESASEVIDKFNEILSFLEGYDDSQTLKGVISDLEQMINDAEDDISLLEKEIKAALDSHINDYNNPHQVTKEQVGLDQVDNTSDLNKPISTLTQQALDYEANLRDEMDTELMNRINVLQGEIDSAGKKIVTDIIDITQNNTSGVQLNYKYKDRVSFDDKYGDEKLASVLLNNASSTNNGVMSKEDKKKFDSIDSKIINDITSITYEPSNIKINYESQNLQDGVYVKSSETKIINSATTSSAGAMSSEDKQTLDAVKTTYIPLNQKGVANGVATLDENGLVPSSQLPSFVDDVIDCYATYNKADDGTLSNIRLYLDQEHQNAISGESGKIYVDITNSDEVASSAYQFRWTGTQFAVVGAPTVIGEVTGTAFDGKRGKDLEDKTNAHIGNTSNPHNVTKAQIGLQNVDNTSDANKPISNATQSALDNKQNTLVSGTNIKTINGESILGEGDITVESGSGVGKVDPNSDGTGEIFNNYENNKATGQYSHAEGNRTKANGNYSHAEGQYTTANGNYSHAEGHSTEATGNYSHAEGYSTEATGNYSHAEGQNTEATGNCSHAEGRSSGGGWYYLKASGDGSHAEGYVSLTTGGGIEASGKGSHAEGFNIFENCKMIAQGDGSHIQNVGTVAKNYGQTSMGCFNEDDEAPKSTSYDASKPALIIGNGTSSAAGNAFKVLFNGKTFADGEYSGAGADYAEMFEWKDGNPNNEDRVGRFVTLENDKIRLAKFTDSYILGIVSGAPTIIGDNPMRWQGKYLNDEWGRPIYGDVEVKYIETEVDENGETSRVEKTRIDHVMKINPEWDSSLEYKSREVRPEWSAIGMMGKLLVRQDGTLNAGEFCHPNADGIATKSESGYYVMKVMSENQALILFK